MWSSVSIKTRKGTPLAKSYRECSENYPFGGGSFWRENYETIAKVISKKVK
jgi:hypothetical protein